MSLPRPVRCRGLLPPAASGVVLLGLLAACGGGSGDDTADGARDESSEGALPAPPRSSLEMARDGDEVTRDDVRAASVVNVWEFEHRRMSKRLEHHHDPGSGSDDSAGADGSVSLRYSAIDATGNLIRLEWPYDGRAVTYRYDDPSVAPSLVAFHDEVARRDWRAIAGSVAIEPMPDGQVLIELAGLQIAESFGVTEGIPEPIADGFVLGDVERVCIEYVPTDSVGAGAQTGEPVPRAQRDDDWSSPFCAQFVQERAATAR